MLEGDWKVSPNYFNSQLVSGEIQKIDVLEDAIENWVFKFADRLTPQNGEEHGGVAILMLAASQIEQLERYWRGDDGEDQSGVFFKAGLKRIFGLNSNTDSDVLELLYKHLRCGLFHMGLFRGCVVISHDRNAALTTEGVAGNRVIVINPSLFLEKVRESFSALVAEVRVGKNPTKANFDRVFDGSYGNIRGRSTTYQIVMGTASPSS